MAVKHKRAWLSVGVFLFVIFLVAGLIMLKPSPRKVRAAEDDPDAINLFDPNNLHWAAAMRTAVAEEGAPEGETVWEYSFLQGVYLGSEAYVYTYQTDDTETFFSFYSAGKLDFAPDPTWKNWKLEKAYVGAESITNSTLPWNGDERVLAIDIPRVNVSSDPYNPQYVPRYTAEYVGNVQTEANTLSHYTATAYLQAAEGQYFYQGEVDEAFYTRGISVTIAEDGKTATVTKRWFIVNALNDLYTDAGGSDDAAVAYSVPSWKFGRIESVPKPYLAHGDERFFEAVPQREGYSVQSNKQNVVQFLDGVYASDRDWLMSFENTEANFSKNDFVTFTLKKISGETVTEICKDQNRSRWDHYFNRYMPVGRYAVTVAVSPLSIGGNWHALWWNGQEENSDAVFGGFSREYAFEVTAEDLEIDDTFQGREMPSVNLKSLKENGFAATVRAFFAADGIHAVYPAESELITQSEVREAGGYWAAFSETHYDSQPHLEFNVAQFNSDAYYTAEDASANWDGIVSSPATYRIYYKAVMQNYGWIVPLPAEKYERYFDLVVYEELPVPVLANGGVYSYTGLPITAEIANATAELLTKITIGENATQTNAAEYTVTFGLKDEKHYRWQGTDEATRSAIFKIEKAQVEVPRRVSKVYTGSAISPLDIPLKADGSPVYTIEGEEQQYIQGGDYRLTLRLSDVGNYVWVTTDGSSHETGTQDGEIVITFTIARAADSWAQPYRLIPWEYGGFLPQLNFFAGAAVSGGEVRYSVASRDGDVYTEREGLNGFALTDGALSSATEAAFKSLPKGVWYFRAFVPESMNYSLLDSGWIPFEVSRAQNVWFGEPYVDAWNWGAYDNHVVSTGNAKFGGEDSKTILYFQLDVSGNPTDGGHRYLYDFDATGAGSLGGIPAGNYRMTVTVAESENYTGLSETVSFTIGKGENRWIVTPGVQNWVYGNKPSFVGEALFGNIRLVISNGSETIFDGDIRDAERQEFLATVRPGVYSYTASVAEVGNYTGLIFGGGTFRVISPLNNGWILAPSIGNWTEGEIANEPSAKPVYNEENMEFRYETALGEQLPAKPTSAGDYVLIAYVPGTDDGYDELETRVPFTVYGKPVLTNGWKVTPDIRDWKEGDTPSEPTGEPYAGNAVYAYRTADGNALAERPSVAGEYILAVTVNAEGYFELAAEVRFRILPSPVKVSVTEQDSNGNPVSVTVDGVKSGSKVSLAEILNAGDNAGFWQYTKDTFWKLGYAMGAIYDIKLTDANGAAIQPDGTVTVTLSVPRWLQDKSGLQIAFVDERGVVELMGGVIDGENIMFTTTHFSNYCFVWAEAAANGAETGWAIFLTVIIEVCVVAALATTVTAFILVWKRKRAYSAASDKAEEEAPSAPKKRPFGKKRK